MAITNIVWDMPNCSSSFVSTITHHKSFMGNATLHHILEKKGIYTVVLVSAIYAFELSKRPSIKVNFMVVAVNINLTMLVLTDIAVISEGPKSI
jgi:hypothetical protein